MFTVDRAPLLSFVGILGFLIPLVAIGLGFDAINGEHNRRTLSRILSQPIYRDALLVGKFLAGLATIGISLLCLWLLVVGFGIICLGVPPSGEEIARSLVFLLVALAYAACGWRWRCCCRSSSARRRRRLLVALGLWLFLTLLWPMMAPGIAQVIAPPDPLRDAGRQLACRRRARRSGNGPDSARLSPNQLFRSCDWRCSSPDTRALGSISSS